MKDWIGIYIVCGTLTAFVAILANPKDDNYTDLTIGISAFIMWPWIWLKLIVRGIRSAL